MSLSLRASVWRLEASCPRRGVDIDGDALCVPPAVEQQQEPLGWRAISYCAPSPVPELELGVARATFDNCSNIAIVAFLVDWYLVLSKHL